MSQGETKLRRTDPLWTKAPLLLLRFRALFVSVAVGALLLALASASHPLFVSAAESDALEQAIRGTSRYGAGIAVTQSDGYRYRAQDIEFRPDFGEVGQYTWLPRTRMLQRRVAELDLLGEPELTVLGPEVAVAAGDAPSTLSVRLLFKTGWPEHVEIVEGSDAGGLWLADTIAETLGVDVGDEVVFSSQSERRSVPIAGLYRALAKDANPGLYWGSLFHEIYPAIQGDPEPPPFAFLEPEAMAELAPSLGYPDARYTWEMPLEVDGQLTLPAAEKLLRQIDAFQEEFGDGSTRLGRAFFCTAFCFTGTGRGAFTSLLSTIVPGVERQIAAIEPPIDLLSTAGTIVALTVIASAGVFMVARRKTEASLLFARGTSAGSVALKSALESLLPVIVGTSAGYGLSHVIVAALGPDGPVDATASGTGLRGALLGIPVAIVLMSLVAALSFLRQSEGASTRLRTFAGLPWEIAVLAAAGFFLRNVLSGHALVEEGRAVTRPSAYLMLFPIFFIGGLAGLAARGLQAPLRALVGRSRALGDATYLTFHRLAGAKRLAVVLVTACALALGILVYAQTVVSSLRSTVEAKSLLFVGSDVQAQIRFDQEAPTDLEHPVTKVTKMPARGILPGRTTAVDVLAIDPKSFAGAAYWSESFGGSLEDLAGRLGESDAGRVPVLISGWDQEVPATLQIDHLTIPIEVIALPSDLPGATLEDPMVAIDVAAIERFNDRAGFPQVLLDNSNSTELWLRGQTQAILDDLASSETEVFQTLTAEEVRTIPSIVTVTRTFGYLKSLGFGAGLLAIVALIMYLQARQRNRIVSFALSRRMGLSNAKHRLSLVLELGSMLLAAFAVASVLALGAARLILAEIEPLRRIPPGSLFEIPFVLLAGCAVVLIVTAIAGGLATNRTAEKANFAEVMRLAA